jgi:hypothetical protein
LNTVDVAWRKGPIVSAVLVNASDSFGGKVFKTPECPQGFEYATTARWFGLVNGCNCKRQVYREFPEIRKGRCTINETLARCETILSQDSLDLPILSEMAICIKREPDLTFYNLERPQFNRQNVNMTVECPYGYKLCGSNSSSFDYTTCVPIAKQCPMVDVSVSLTGNRSMMF